MYSRLTYVMNSQKNFKILFLVLMSNYLSEIYSVIYWKIPELIDDQDDGWRERSEMTSK